jgi:hypothetical protein
MSGQRMAAVITGLPIVHGCEFVLNIVKGNGYRIVKLVISLASIAMEIHIFTVARRSILIFLLIRTLGEG